MHRDGCNCRHGWNTKENKVPSLRPLVYISSLQNGFIRFSISQRFETLGLNMNNSANFYISTFTHLEQ